jgi:hypothetical protein
VDEYEKAKVTPVTILNRILMKKSNKTATIGLTHWSNLFEEDARWDELSRQGEKIVTTHDLWWGRER